MRKAKQTEQREIGRVKLSNTRELVASIVDDEKLDLRIWVDSNNYKGWTKQGLRFYLFDGNWEEFKKLVEKVDKEYGADSLRLGRDQARREEHTPTET